jgi:recombinational DNA repair protein RecT
MTRWLKKQFYAICSLKWGILSIDMQRAYVNDIDDPEQTKEVIDVEWSEIIEEANVANSPEQ